MRNTLPKIGLIGVSGYASTYVKWLLEAWTQRKLDIVAFVAIGEDRDSHNAQQLVAAGASHYGSYESMLQDKSGELDLCLIPTSIHWHSRMSVAALEAGCNVLVEKPLAGSVHDGTKMIEAVKATGNWLALGFQDIYTDEVLAIKREILAGRIGRIKSVSMLGIWPRPHSYYQRNDWAGKVLTSDFVLDSPMNNAFAHFINMSLFLAAKTLQDSCDVFLNSIQLFRAHRIDSFDTAVVEATSEAGVEFWFGVSHAHNETIDPIIRIEGSLGSIEWHQEKHCLIRTDSEEEILPLDDSFAARAKMLETVLEKLEDPSLRVCGPDIGLCHTRLIETIHRFGTIHDFAPSLVEERDLPGEISTVPSVQGLKEALLEAFESRSNLDAAKLSDPATSNPELRTSGSQQTRQEASISFQYRFPDSLHSACQARKSEIGTQAETPAQISG